MDFLVVLIVAAITSVSEGALLGERCSSTGDCNVEVSTSLCVDSRCACPPDRFASDSSTCVLKRPYNGSCESAQECAPLFSACRRGRCVCQRGKFWFQTSCHNISEVTPLRRSYSIRDTSIYVSWQMDIAFFNAISEYVITWSHDGVRVGRTTVTRRMTGTSTYQTYTISGLTGRTEYDIEIVSKIEDDPYSQTSPPLSLRYRTRATYGQNCTSSADCYLSTCREDRCFCHTGNFRFGSGCRSVNYLRPYRVKASDVTATSVAAEWLLSSSYTPLVTLYSVTCRSHDNQHNVTVNATSLAADLAGLEPGTQYSVSVSSLLVADALEQWSKPSSAITVSTRPDVPGSVVEEESMVGSDMMLLIFQSVARGGADSYHVMLVSANETLESVERAGNSTAAVFTGLRPQHLYTVNITAGFQGMTGDSYAFAVETLQQGQGPRALKEATYGQICTSSADCYLSTCREDRCFCHTGNFRFGSDCRSARDVEVNDAASPATVPAYAVVIALFLPTVVLSTVLGLAISRQPGDDVTTKVRNLLQPRPLHLGDAAGRTDKVKATCIPKDKPQGVRAADNIYDVMEGQEYERHYEHLRQK